MPEGNAFDRLDSAYQDALLRSIDLCIDEAVADVATLLDDGEWAELLFLPSALPDRPMYVARYTPLFAKQFLVCLIAVAGKLTSGMEIRPASVAEEIALHALIQRATGPSGEEEFDFEDFVDEVFEDTDFLWLFEPNFNGIQHTPAQKTLRTANLDIEDWFLPFRDELRVHPYAATDTEPRPARDAKSNDLDRMN